MSEVETNNAKSNGTGFVWGVLVAVVLYVLSVGPAVYVAARFPQSLSTVCAIYKPVEWLYDTPLGRPLNYYCIFWVRLARNADP